MVLVCEAFLGSVRQPPLTGPYGPFGIGSRLSQRICLPGNVYHLTAENPPPAGDLAPVSLLRLVTAYSWYGNVDPFPIVYASRPRLRSRLTQRRISLRWKPWAYGVTVFHRHCRYSCQHSHFRYLHGRLPSRFTGLRNAPLPLGSEDPNPKLRCIT